MILPDKALLRPDEVAELFRVSNRTVRNWHKAGVIEGVRLPRGLRFEREEIEEFIKRVRRG